MAVEVLTLESLSYCGGSGNPENQTFSARQKFQSTKGLFLPSTRDASDATASTRNSLRRRLNRASSTGARGDRHG